MAAIKLTKAKHIINANLTDHAKANHTIRDRFFAFADAQKSNRTLWFFLVLMIHGIFILPIPAVLMYYFNAPEWVLGVTMTSFFVNIVANMAGSSTRTTLAMFGGSILLHLLLLLVFII